MKSKKLIAIPVEIYQREFYLVVYLAILATRKGYQVLIGQQNEPVFNKIKRAVIYHKDHSPWSYNFLIKKIKNHNKIVLHDVEGLIYFNEKDFDERIGKKVFEIADVIFAWGQNQYNLISKTITDCDNLIITGSPKFDICNLISTKKISKTGRALKILVNTRFALNNSLRGENHQENFERELQNEKDLGVIKSKEDLDHFNNMFKSEVEIYNEFISLISNLAKDEAITITVRPHPAENINKYKKIFKLNKNVIVNNSDSLNQQLIKHDCLIHDGCTTAIEARAIGMPVFGLRPKNLDYTYSEFANNFSTNFYCNLTLVKFLKHTNIEDYEMPDCDDKARFSISNWKNNNKNATHKMLNHIERIDITPQSIIQKNKLKYNDIKTIVYNLLEKVNILSCCASLVFPYLYKRLLNSRKTIDRKFKDINISEVKEIINELNSIDPTTSKINKLNIEVIGSKSFVIYDK